MAATIIASREGHWLIDTLITNPMSAYPEYKASRTSLGHRRSWLDRGRDRDRVRRDRRRHRFRRAVRRLAGPQPFLPLPDRRRMPATSSDLGPDVPRLDALWPQGPADRGDLGGRPGAVGPRRQAPRRAGLQPDRRQEPRGDQLLLHRPGTRRGEGAGLLGRQGAAAAMARSTAKAGCAPISSSSRHIARRSGRTSR